GSGTMKVSGIDDGDWILVAGVDFGADGAAVFGGTFSVTKGAKGSVTVRLDSLTDGTDAAVLPVCDGDGNASRYRGGVSLTEKITGVHDVYFLFSGSGYEWIDWKFSK
ncbi:MAG: carbohydrate-binding protein, partial [Lachnospiraceae bacterium]|nr:carbohydrate-binding protein [Lachnospiraceae bacterium]